MKPSISRRNSISFAVLGYSYVTVFMTGAIIKGYFFDLISHALTMHVSRLSHIPFDIFVSVLELRGAINMREAIFLNSM